MDSRASEFQARLATLRGQEAADPGAALSTLEAAEALLAPGFAGDPAAWRAYLDRTRHPDFLTALPDDAARRRWAETTFAAVDGTGFGLRDMLAQRVAAHPGRPLFQVAEGDGLQSWSYAQVLRRVDAIAALLHGADPEGARPPRVVLLSENSLSGACCDLACLLHGILVSPLNTHFDTDTLVWILDALEVTVAITDDRAKYRRLREVRERTRRPFRILVLHMGTGESGSDDAQLDEALTLLGPAEVRARLARHSPRGLHDPATVMFTSGSTGLPKGVVFTQYNLVTKRFARAAALPAVGEREVLLCYLPLFHTFGRYLEMLGAMFWGGTYVFAGNPSTDTLLARLRQVRPTGMISIPLRWQQIRDQVLERVRVAGDEAGEEAGEKVLREVVGGRLRWGLSAAGYLDPRVFRFFQRHGVDLCSGFGMTEATGGITMTPPGGYRDQSVGVPLPGVHARFTDEGELQIAGPYIARYYEVGEDLDAPGPPPPSPGGAAHWVSTGDLFREIEDGHLQIVDRIKDIYKNNRGQTIAPRRVEERFVDVVGIKRTFLAGDGRAYNTLLIVPDRDEPALQALSGPEGEREYFHQIVTAANSDLASFERVVNFAVLDRDFDVEHGELTPKGSFRRKAIEDNFKEEIAALYQSDRVELVWGEYRVLIPRWFYRDVGILETDIEVLPEGLHDTVRDRRLPLRLRAEKGWVEVGDLAYCLEGRTIDLGQFTRQPLLWGGNPSLEAFCPCRPGWDTKRVGVGEQVLLPETRPATDVIVPMPRERRLATVDALCCTAITEEGEHALAAVDGLAQHLLTTDGRLGTLIRRRLEALARHPDEEVRCRAYHALVLDEPSPDYNRYLPAFIQSGRTFLSEDSIAAIAGAHIEPRRLQAFRQRLHTYRTQLAWPADEVTRHVFDDLFRLLCNFVHYHSEYYGMVREELAAWALLDKDPELAQHAAGHLHRLAAWFEGGLRERSADLNPAAWEEKIVFQDSLSSAEIARLREVLVGTTFLAQTILLIFEGESFALADVGADGIWVSRILSSHQYSRYRVSVNTRRGKHFDIQLVIRDDLDEAWVMETILWLIAIRGYPHDAPILGNFGCCRPELGALSQAYTSDLTVWEKVREFSSTHGPGTGPQGREIWRRLFVRAMALYFKGWYYSGERIVPGAVSPSNVSVPEPDFRQGARIQSLVGWRKYDGPLSLVLPLVQNFFLQTASHYPWCRRILDHAWIFEACAEALGRKRGKAFLEELRSDLERRSIVGVGAGFLAKLERAILDLEECYRPPLTVQGAIDRYARWAAANDQATRGARLQIVEELMRLYRFDLHDSLARYHLFRHTYFVDAEPAVQEHFDHLLSQLFRHPTIRPTQLVELSDLQAALTDDDDRKAVRRLAFPRTAEGMRMDVVAVGDRAKGKTILTSQIIDNRGTEYTVREPTAAAEVGQLYRLFLVAGFPKTISVEDRFLIAIGGEEQIIGGVCYQVPENEIVNLDGIVVTGSLLDRGITSALLEDFCARMTEQGHEAIRTHFFLRTFYQRHGFRIDNRWGGLVRFLTEPLPASGSQGAQVP